MTLDDLTAAYTQIMENKFDLMEFHAKLQGIDIKRPNMDSGDVKTKRDEFNDRIRQKVEEQNLQKARSGQKVKIADGVGYQVIGG
jgi:superfamily II RNA helicase